MSQHLESMGDKWFTLLKSPDMIPGVIGTTVAEGGTRPIWRIEEGDSETFLMHGRGNPCCAPALSSRGARMPILILRAYFPFWRALLIR